MFSKSNSFSNGADNTGPIKRGVLNRLIEIIHGWDCCCGWCLQGHK